MSEKVNDAPVKKQRRGIAEVLHRLSKSPLAMFGLAFILFLVFCAIFCEQLAPYPYAKIGRAHV